MDDKNKTNSQTQATNIPEGVKGPGGKPLQIPNAPKPGESAPVSREEAQIKVHRQPGVAPDTLYVQVSSPERTLYDSEAKSISSFNDHGPFDILPQHENFISVIQQGVVVFNQQDQPQEFLLRNGVLRVTENRVDIFIGF